MEQQFSRTEKRLQKQIQKEEEKKKNSRQKKIRKIFLAVLGAVIVGGGIAGFFWYFSSKPPLLESDIVAKRGIHWHPEIAITILGKRQEIPAGIGLGFSEQPIHTHERNGVIHVEFLGLVKKSDLRLGRFFEIWEKRFNQDCIFDKCNGVEGKLKMLVNGKENFEFENYIMHDQDKIEIIFE